MPQAHALGRSAVMIEHLGAAAQDHRLDALFAARAALKRAYAVRSAAELQVDQLRALVDRLEAERLEPVLTPSRAAALRSR